MVYDFLLFAELNIAIINNYYNSNYFSNILRPIISPYSVPAASGGGNEGYRSDLKRQKNCKKNVVTIYNTLCYDILHKG